MKREEVALGERDRRAVEFDAHVADVMLGGGEHVADCVPDQVGDEVLGGTIDDAVFKSAIFPKNGAKQFDVQPVNPASVAKQNVADLLLVNQALY